MSSQPTESIMCCITCSSETAPCVAVGQWNAFAVAWDVNIYDFTLIERMESMLPNLPQRMTIHKFHKYWRQRWGSSIQPTDEKQNYPKCPSFAQVILTVIRTPKGVLRPCPDTNLFPPPSDVFFLFFFLFFFFFFLDGTTFQWGPLLP